MGGNRSLETFLSLYFECNSYNGHIHTSLPELHCAILLPSDGRRGQISPLGRNPRVMIEVNVVLI